MTDISNETLDEVERAAAKLHKARCYADELKGQKGDEPVLVKEFILDTDLRSLDAALSRLRAEREVK